MNNLFSDLVFDEKHHTYHVNKVKLRSVSAECKKFYKEFDAQNISLAMAKKQSDDSRIVKKIQQEILNNWKVSGDEAATLGTLVHKFGEDYIGSNRTLLPISDYDKSIISFWSELNPIYDVVEQELRMYNLKLGLAGTLDILLYNKETDSYAIYDYKTNKDLYSNYKNQKMLPPFDDMLDTPYSHYVIQQNLYALMLELVGIHVDEMCLISVRPEGYSLHEIPDIRTKLKEYYKC